jgi:hypothetical protein
MVSMRLFVALYVAIIVAEVIGCAYFLEKSNLQTDNIKTDVVHMNDTFDKIDVSLDHIQEILHLAN